MVGLLVTCGAVMHPWHCIAYHTSSAPPCFDLPGCWIVQWLQLYFLCCSGAAVPEAELCGNAAARGGAHIGACAPT